MSKFTSVKIFNQNQVLSKGQEVLESPKSRKTVNEFLTTDKLIRDTNLLLSDLNATLSVEKPEISKLLSKKAVEEYEVIAEKLNDTK